MRNIENHFDAIQEGVGGVIGEAERFRPSSVRMSCWICSPDCLTWRCRNLPNSSPWRRPLTGKRTSVRWLPPGMNSACLPRALRMRTLPLPPVPSDYRFRRAS